MTTENTSGGQDVGIIEKAFLMGIGAAMLAKDKAQDLADMLIERGAMTRDESREFVDRLTEQAQEAGRTAGDVMGTEAERMATKLGLATSKDVEQIRAELSDIKAQIASMRPMTEPSAGAAAEAAEAFVHAEPQEP